MLIALLLAGTNLLVNPSFEDWPEGQLTPTGWVTHDRKTGPERISRMAAVGTDGEFSVLFRNGSMGNMLAQKAEVEPGAFYNLSCDAKTDVGMYEFRMFTHWEDAKGKRVADVFKPSGVNYARVKSPWTKLELKNLKVPPTAKWLAVELVPNDCWSKNGVPGTIQVDNVALVKSGAVSDDRPASVEPTDALTVVCSELSPKCDRAGLLVRAGAKPVKATLVAEELLPENQVLSVGRIELSLGADEERSVFLPLDASSETVRLSLWIGRRLVWRRRGEKGVTRLQVGPQDPYGVRRGRIFIPNDARWYVNLPITHNLTGKTGNKVYGNPTNLNARLFVEVPEGIAVPHVKYSDWGQDLPIRKPLAETRITKRGVPYVRYELPVYISGVNKPLVFFTSTLPVGARRTAFVYLTWDGGRQVPVELDCEIVSYGRVKPFERMQMRLDDATINLAQAICDDPAKELPTMGINVWRIPMDGGDARLRPFAAKLRGSGLGWRFNIQNELNDALRYWGNRFDYGQFRDMEPDPDSHFIDIDGKPVKCAFGFLTVCPLYEGRNLHETARRVAESAAVKEYGVDWLVFDWEFWGPRPCYCDRCRRVFRETWCPEKGLPDFGDPREFMRDEKANAVAAKAYLDFYWWGRGQLYVNFKKALKEKSGVDFRMSDWTWPRPHLLPGMDFFDCSFGYKTPESVMQRIEDTYTNVLKGASGKLTCSICPMQGCELNEKYPPETTYHNILEAAALGVRGFEWWFAPICESMTWKYVMDGLRAIRPFEDLILDGRVKVRGDGENCTWRRVSLGDEALYCVRNYALKGPATVRFATNGREGLEVRDAATGERICGLHDGRNTVELLLSPANPVRLLYVGSRFGSRCAAEPVARFDGEVNARNGWKLVAGEEGKTVYIPFEGYYESKGGRIESPKFSLDKGDDENAWYSLVFDARSETDGYWWVDFFDRDGNLLPDVNSRLYASADWRSYDVVVPSRPEAMSAQIAFVSKKGSFAKDVTMRRISAEEAFQWCERLYASLPQIGRTALEGPEGSSFRLGKRCRVVFLGDSIMNDTWCGNVGAMLRHDFPGVDFRLYLSVRGSTGCWYYHEKEHFNEYVAKYRPDVVVIGGISNWLGPEKSTVREAEDWMVETVERCKAIGAEVIICTPPPSYEFRTSPEAKPFDRSLCEEGGLPCLRWDFHRRAAVRTGVRLWDLTTGPCEAIARSGRPIGWFKRDAAHNDDRGKQFVARAMADCFREAMER